MTAFPPTRMAYEAELSYLVQAAGSDFIFNGLAARTPKSADAGPGGRA